MQLIPGSFDTKLLTLMSAALDAAVRSAGYAVGVRSDDGKDPAELQRIALTGVEVPAVAVAEVLPYPPYSLPITHRYSA